MHKTVFKIEFKQVGAPFLGLGLGGKGYAGNQGYGGGQNYGGSVDNFLK